jgi:osmotically-inducible protein OsmY
MNLAPQALATTEPTLNERVGQALAEQSYLPGKLLRFETSEDCVILHGRVKSFFHKQMAQETLRRVAGVKQIDNRVLVVWDE